MSDFINDDMKFFVVNDKGEQIECEVLFTFENTENGKNYIVYTDNTKDEAGSTKVFASIYDPESEGDETRLIPIETDEEWEFIQKLLEELQEEALGEDADD